MAGAAVGTPLRPATGPADQPGCSIRSASAHTLVRRSVGAQQAQHASGNIPPAPPLLRQARSVSDAPASVPGGVPDIAPGPSSSLPDPMLALPPVASDTPARVAPARQQPDQNQPDILHAAPVDTLARFAVDRRPDQPLMLQTAAMRTTARLRPLPPDPLQRMGARLAGSNPPAVPVGSALPDGPALPVSSRGMAAPGPDAHVRDLPIARQERTHPAAATALTPAVPAGVPAHPIDRMPEPTAQVDVPLSSLAPHALDQDTSAAPQTGNVESAPPEHTLAARDPLPYATMPVLPDRMSGAAAPIPHHAAAADEPQPAHATTERRATHAAVPLAARLLQRYSPAGQISNARSLLFLRTQSVLPPARSTGETPESGIRRLPAPAAPPPGHAPLTHLDVSSVPGFPAPAPTAPGHSAILPALPAVASTEHIPFTESSTAWETPEEYQTEIQRAPLPVSLRKETTGVAGWSPVPLADRIMARHTVSGRHAPVAAAPGPHVTHSQGTPTGQPTLARLPDLPAGDLERWGSVAASPSTPELPAEGDQALGATGLLGGQPPAGYPALPDPGARSMPMAAPGAAYQPPLELARPAAMLPQPPPVDAPGTEAPTAASSSGGEAMNAERSTPDIDAITRKVYDNLRRRLLIEQERRGRSC